MVEFEVAQFRFGAEHEHDAAHRDREGKIRKECKRGPGLGYTLGDSRLTERLRPLVQHQHMLRVVEMQ